MNVSIDLQTQCVIVQSIAKNITRSWIRRSACGDTVLVYYALHGLPVLKCITFQIALMAYAERRIRQIPVIGRQQRKYWHIYPDFFHIKTTSKLVKS